MKRIMSFKQVIFLALLICLGIFLAPHGTSAIISPSLNMSCTLNAQQNGSSITYTAQMGTTCSGDCGATMTGMTSKIVISGNLATQERSCPNPGCYLQYTDTFTPGTYTATATCYEYAGTGTTYTATSNTTTNTVTDTPTPTPPGGGGGGGGGTCPTSLNANTGVNCTTGYSVKSISTQNTAADCFNYCMSQQTEDCEWSSGNLQCWAQNCTSGSLFGAGGWYAQMIPSACFAPANNYSPVGSFDAADCVSMSGWAFDPDYAGPIEVDIYSGNQDGTGLVPQAGVMANGSRPDVQAWAAAVGYSPPDRTVSGFSWTIAQSLKDGYTHYLWPLAINYDAAGNKNGGFAITSYTPKAITCNDVPTGTLSAYTCGSPNDTATGTASDAQGTPVNVVIYDGVAGSGGVQIGSGTANPNYSISTTRITNGQTHQIYAYAQDIPGGTWYQIGTRAATCAPTLSFTANPTTINQGSTSTVTWSTVNATSCTASGGDAGWAGARPTSGTRTSNPLISNTTYSMSCTNAVGASANGSATVTVNVVAPTATITSLTQPDYCSSGPAVTSNWRYSSSIGLPRSQWQMQIASDAGFSTIVYDSGMQVFNKNSSTFTSNWIHRIWNFIAQVFTDKAEAAPLTVDYASNGGQGVLQFNRTYWVRMKTWDSSNTASAWSAASSFNTPSGAYPSVNFTIAPTRPIAKQVTTFTDTSNYNGSTALSRTWDFGDGTIVTETPGTGTATHTFPAGISAANVRLTITSTSTTPNSCSNTQTLSIMKSIPIYKEVRPGANVSPTP